MHHKARSSHHVGALQTAAAWPPHELWSRADGMSGNESTCTGRWQGASAAQPAWITRQWLLEPHLDWMTGQMSGRIMHVQSRNTYRDLRSPRQHRLQV